jgi:hypothetical protein
MPSRSRVWKNVTAASRKLLMHLRVPAISADHQLTRHSASHGAKEYLALIRFRIATPDTRLNRFKQTFA